jgi:hypothetical protein
VKARLISALTVGVLALTTTSAWADNDGRPHVSNIGGDDHSPGVTLVLFLSLLIVGFGVGFIVGRRTRNK